MVDLTMPELLLELVRALPLVHNTHHLDTLFSVLVFVAKASKKSLLEKSLVS